ncbi:alpha-1,6-mannosylglycoprotein 6-beta-N-acetylglucosaminyltransferase B-like isoform X2 [Dysidea avara]|uniref:alpha-1,6-mannosylglycoprotein 6-beta-N-acetylglucosaminyltransferase B-like isoform X2 n=1 Tax=Dysidea avara TaxID=196820 RepID=UPI00331FB869
MVYVSRSGPVSRKLWTIIGGFKWILILGLVYLLVYMVVIALEKDLGSVEPVSVKSKIQAQLHSYFEARSLPKSHFTPGSADLDSLVNSRMFKEQSSKLAWIKKRLQSMKTGWEEAAIILSERHPELFSSPKNILLFPGLLTEYSAYDFAKMAFKGGYLGELVQWSDLIATLYMLGHDVVISTSIPNLRKQVAAIEHPFDVVMTDFIGLWGLRDADLFGYYKCRIRVLDSFGTEPLSNFRTKQYIPPDSGEQFANWNFEDTRQFWTLYPHSPDNSFLGFAMEKPVMTYTGERKNQAVIYGKKAYYVYGMEKFLDTVGEYMEIHSTFSDDVSKIPNHIVNHGVLSQPDLAHLLQSSKLFIGVGFPFEGPGPLEALANGCVHIQPHFPSPISRANNAFFRNKPTGRNLTSQNPYLEKFVEEPYVYTVDLKNETAVRAVIRKVLLMKNLSSYLPFEFTQRGMLERIGFYVLYQDFCGGENLAINKKATASSHFGVHSAQQAIDGVSTSETCYWSESSVSSWWELDLGVDIAIDKIRITHTFEWIVAKSWNTFIVPFEVSLLNSLGKTVNSKVFTSESLFYLWEGVHSRARYIRIDTLQYRTPRHLVLCNVEVFGINDTQSVMWPHPSLLNIRNGNSGQSCVEACADHQMVCEPGYFPLLNNAKALFNSCNCSDFKKISDQYLDMLPAVLTQRDKTYGYPAGMCLATDISLLLSCVGKRTGYQRLCPCRHYRNDQVALPLEHW